MSASWSGELLARPAPTSATNSGPPVGGAAAAAAAAGSAAICEAAVSAIRWKPPLEPRGARSDARDPVLTRLDIAAAAFNASTPHIAVADASARCAPLGALPNSAPHKQT
jgi:hypothetical protein